MTIPVGKISDHDIESILNKLGLEAIDPARKEFIKCLDTVDVSACPGSGKTTLVVAKLLLLMEKWQPPSQGICVLSHTNVAKDEVASRLSRLGMSHSVNGHPHFVGTIDSFVSKYVATPFLTSMGFPPERVDEEYALSWRERRVGKYGNDFWNNHPNTPLKEIKLTQVSRSEPFGEKLTSGNRIPGKATPTYKEFARIYWQSIKSGILTHDEIFVFAQRALEVCPEMGTAIRSRFPFVVIDEAQDCTAMRLDLLHQIFEVGGNESVVQRVGDPNQAIYSTAESTSSGTPKAAAAFPRANYLTIADSHRLNNNIARVANLLAVDKIKGGLQGKLGNNMDKPLHFILFDTDNIDNVLPRFAEIVSSTVPQEVLGEQCKIAAVGSRVRGNDDKKPYSVGDYYSTFSADVRRRRIPKFNHFVEYVSFARKVTGDSGNLSDGVGVLAEGVFRTLEQVNEIDLKAYTEKSTYRRLIALLEDKGVDCSPVKEGFATVLNVEDFAQVYDSTDLLKSLKALLSSNVWRKNGKDITGFFCLVAPEVNTANSLVEHELHSTLRRGNLYTSKGVTIQLDSIHGVKGETHTALLLLDTCYNGVYFVDILLRKIISKQRSISAAQEQRIRQGFVAFTRPTHLLAVAASKKSLGKNNSEIESSISQLREQGWVIDMSLYNTN